MAVIDTRDDGPRTGKRADPQRMCIVTREVKPETDLVRFVLAPDSTVVPDLKRRLPGRGVWVSASAEAISQARQRKLFARGFRQTVTVAPELPEQIAAMLRHSTLGVIGLARKAGALVTGFAKVEALTRAGQASCILHAAEAAGDGVNKLRAARRSVVTADGDEEIRAWCLFTGAELDDAVGTPNVMHAAARDDDQGRQVSAATERLARFLGQNAV